MTGAVHVVRPRRSGLDGLLGACHPVPTAGVTLVATALAAGVVGPAWPRVVLLAAAVLTGQLSIGWSNDAIDATRDARTGRSGKPAASGAVQRRTVATAAAAALLATTVLSVLLGAAPGAALLTLVAAGWAYNLGLKATVLSGVPYAVGFGALPLAPYLARDGQLPAWWVPAVGALLGLAAHFANVLPDLRSDALTGVRGLPQRLGARRGVAVMALTLAAASVVLGVGPPATSAVFAVGASAAGIVAAAVAVVLALHRPDTQAAFRLTLGIAVLDVALVLVVAG